MTAPEHLQLYHLPKGNGLSYSKFNLIRNSINTLATYISSNTVETSTNTVEINFVDRRR